MSSDWMKGSLGDFIELKRGYDLPKTKREPGTVPLVSSSGESDTHSKAMVKGPGVVTGRYGTIGQVFYIKKDFWPLNTTLYVRDFKGNDPRFISYFLKTLNFDAYSDKGAVPGVNRNHLHEAEVLIPSLKLQKRMAKILEGLDDSIDTLQRQNTTLEAIAQQLFRSWFVNFDPVHAKAAGKEPEAMSAELAALFPSDFEESALGLIPKGWLAGSLSDISLLNPEAWSGRNHPAEVTYLDLSGIKKNSIPEVIKYKYDEAPSRARRVLKKGDSLYGTVRPGNLSYGYIGEDEAGLTGSTGFAVLRPKHAQDSEYVYCAMTLKESIERLVLLADGAAYPAVRPEIVHGKETVLADEKVMAAFHRITKPLFQQITINKSTIKCLCELRDHLLPRLISGKLSLAEAEAALAAAKPEVEQA